MCLNARLPSCLPSAYHGETGGSPGRPLLFESCIARGPVASPGTGISSFYSAPRVASSGKVLAFD